MMNDSAQVDHPNSEFDLERIETLCEEFETKLRAGKQPRIEDVLQAATSRDRAPLLEELILQELYYRKPASLALALEDYVKRFPQDAAVLKRIPARLDAQTPASTRSFKGPEPIESRPDARLIVPKFDVGAGSESLDLRNLLHRRLRLVAFICAGAYAAEIIRCTFTATTGRLFFTDVFSYQTYLISNWVLGITMLALTVLLTLLKSLTLGTLRFIDKLLIVTTVVWGAWVTYTFWHRYRDLYASLPQEYGPTLQFLAQSLTSFWAIVILAYGLLIPNSRRHILLSSLLIAATPIMAILLAEILNMSFTVAQLLESSVAMGIWVGIAAVLTVFGAGRIETLRQQVLEGKKLGQYRLKEQLGQGGMGEVYLAEHALLRRPCAVKVIKPEHSGDPSAILRFEREVQATATLTSPHTVEIYDYGQTPDRLFYYVMEYLPGVDLDRLVKTHGPLPPGRVIYLLRQLCNALQEAHQQGLLHRDIKPSNVILCERGGHYDRVKLLDFGLVRVISASESNEQLTQVGAIAGTPAYLSPEQAQGQSDLDARSDIYSLGALAYFLLAGHPPFHQMSQMRIVAAHIYEPVPPLRELDESLPEDLSAIVHRCLEKHPDHRFQSIIQFDEALAKCRSSTDWGEAQARDWWLTRNSSESMNRNEKAQQSNHVD